MGGGAVGVSLERSLKSVKLPSSSEILVLNFTTPGSSESKL